MIYIVYSSSFPVYTTTTAMIFSPHHHPQLVLLLSFSLLSITVVAGSDPGISDVIPVAVYDASMSQGLALSSIPNLPPHPVGSGTCSSCSPGACSTCWESCGSCPTTPTETIYGCPNLNQWALSFDDGLLGRCV